MKQLIVSLNTTTISSRLLDAKSPSIKLMRSMEIFAQHPFLVQSVVGVTKPVWFKTHVSGLEMASTFDHFVANSFDHPGYDVPCLARRVNCYST